MSLIFLLQETRTLFHLRTAGFNTGKQTLKVQPRKVANALAQLEEGEAAAIYHLQSGHSPLNEYSHRFNHHPTGKCDYYRIPEMVVHFLLHFKYFKTQRKKFRMLVKEEEVKVNMYSLPALLNTTQVYSLLARFVLDTGQFRFLKTYTSWRKASKATPTRENQHEDASPSALRSALI